MDGSALRKADLASLLSLIILCCDSSCAFKIRGKKNPAKTITNIAILIALIFFIIINF
jgi:hypothetical protein